MNKNLKDDVSWLKQQLQQKNNRVIISLFVASAVVIFFIVDEGIDFASLQELMEFTGGFLGTFAGTYIFLFLLNRYILSD